MPAPSPAAAPSRGGPSTVEFVALIALAISMVAMSIDSMLPALGSIADSLGARGDNDRQLVLTMFFAGLTFGQLVYGPLADALGRKRSMYVGLSVLAAGTAVCATATSFPIMLAGRFVAGLGAAGPRIVSVAIVRDRYAGSAMARIMSIVMAIFILVPIIAPSVGQGTLLVASWRAIFAGLFVMAGVVALWFALRQPETLAVEDRQPLSFGPVARAVAETVSNRVTLGYALAAGLIFGAMVAFLATAQQIFGEQYGLGKQFPLYFAVLASGLGAASLLNARLVMRFGMRAISGYALRTSATASALFFGLALATGGHPPLLAFTGYLLVVFFCNGLMFGNFNALAMEPMGHIAGSAAAVVGSLSSLISVLIGTPIGRAYDGTVTPLVAGLSVLTVTALAVTKWADRGAERSTQAATS
ncbi:MAG TPA: multidrug effflux MFS transporter [Polyangiaceae bacterium]|nr:multidrug effflux MFS transporter [Polyangiaceae bacterium]